MCKFSSKSEGVPFQISFFLGDLTRNDPAGRYLTERKRKKLRKTRWRSMGRVAEREIEDYENMIKIMTEVGECMNDDKRVCKEDRSGWFNKEVKRSIQEWKKANKVYRLMRRVCGWVMQE